MKTLTPRLGHRLVSLLIVVLVLPTVVWMFVDQRVWPWDPGYYGYWTLMSAHAMGEGLRAWLDINLHALKMMPPLITWLGQFLVPLRHVTGDVETALLLQIVATTAGTLVVVYRTIIRFAPTEARGVTAGLAGVAVCGGAPLFVGLSHHYLTEIPQCFAAALSVAVAWRVERRSTARNIAYVTLMIAFAFLAKASSLIFVLPALAYIAVALLIARGDVRPHAVRADAGLLAAAAAALGLTISWYAANWDVMATHFVQASVGAEVQNYFDAATLPAKLRLWTLALADGLSATRILTLALTVMTMAALAMAISKLREKERMLHAAVVDGALFALYLAGTIIAVVFAYAMQINEDPRYIVALIPVAAILVGWALVEIRQTRLAILVAIMSIANAAVVHASSFGIEILNRHPWIWVADSSPADKEVLTRIVATTCKAGEITAVAMGISYPWINGNSANFYASKRRLTIEADCVYHFTPQEDLEKTLAWLDAVNIRYVVIVPPAQQDPVNFANLLAKPFAEHVAASPAFEMLPETIGRFRIYQRIDRADVLSPGG